MNNLRIVLLGKSGVGKSITGNTIHNEKAFNTECSEIQKCESRTYCTNEREITLVDTPGFFDTRLPQEELKSEILHCITECAPGPHAFLIVLRHGKYTEQEREVVKEITASFGEDALRYAVVLFTHGDQLSENMTIQDFVAESTELQDLVEKCGGRVHVIDNKYWKQQQDGYRSNRVQVKNLLNTIEEMVKKNGGRPYTSEMLQMVHRAIEEDRRKQANQRMYKKWLVRLFGVVTGMLTGALLGFLIPHLCAQSSMTNLAEQHISVVAATVLGLAGGWAGYKAVKGTETYGRKCKKSS